MLTLKHSSISDIYHYSLYENLHEIVILVRIKVPAIIAVSTKMVFLSFSLYIVIFYYII